MTNSKNGPTAKIAATATSSDASDPSPPYSANPREKEEEVMMLTNGGGGEETDEAEASKFSFPDSSTPGSETPPTEEEVLGGGSPLRLLEKDSAITSPATRHIILTATLFENLIFSGIVFGWPALFYMLKTEKIYEHLCRPIFANGSSADQVLFNAILDIENGNATPVGPDEPLTLIKFDCSKQENVLNSAYTIGIFAMGFTSFLWGFMLDSYGIRFVRLALNFLITLGCVLLWLTSEQNSVLILPAIIILGLIGVPLRIANMQIADYYPRKRSTVITVFSGAFSASPVVFVLCKYAYDHLQLSYRAVMAAPLFLSLLMLPTTLYCLPKHSVRNREAKMWQRWEQYRRALGLEKLEDENQMPVSVLPVKEEEKPRCIARNKLEQLLEQAKLQQQQQNEAKKNAERMNKKKGGSLLNLYLAKKGGKEQSSSELMLGEGDEQSSFLGNDSGLASEGSLSEGNNNNNNNSNNNGSSLVKKAIIVPRGELSKAKPKSTGPCGKLMQLFRGASAQDDIPLSVSLFSVSFLAHQLWFSWLNTYMVLYSGSLVLWLARVTTDLEATRNFTQAFGLVQVSAILFAPCAGYIMDRSVAAAFGESDQSKRRLCQAQSGFVPILITTATLTIACACRFFNTSAAVYASLVFITLLRSFLIAVASAYIRVRFPASHFSRLNGIMCTTGAFFSLLQSPLFYFEAQSNEMAFYVNFFCAFMTALSWLNPIVLGITSLQKHFIRKEDMYAEKLLKDKLARQAAKL